jgi:hypothetical protein
MCFAKKPSIMHSGKPKQRIITLEHILLGVTLSCICAAQYSIKYSVNPNMPSAASKLFGPINLIILGFALHFRRKYGPAALWTAVAADIVATCLVALVSTLAT